MPWMTQVLIDISEWLLRGSPPGWVVILLSPIIILLVYRLIRQAYVGRYVVDTIKIKIPIMGQISSKSGIARFTRTRMAW